MLDGLKAALRSLRNSPTFHRRRARRADARHRRQHRDLLRRRRRRAPRAAVRRARSHRRSALEHRPQRRRPSSDTRAADVLRLAARPGVFEELAASAGVQFRLLEGGRRAGDAHRQRITARLVPGAPRRAGARARLHRGRRGRRTAAVAIISDGLWRRRFGGDPDVLGKTLGLNERSWTIVGVMPRGFTYPLGSPDPSSCGCRSRSRGRGSHAQAGTQLHLDRGRAPEGRASRWNRRRRRCSASRRRSPSASAVVPEAETTIVMPLTTHCAGRVAAWMLLLLGAVALVLLIACVNVANLMLARASCAAARWASRRRSAADAGGWRGRCWSRASCSRLPAPRSACCRALAACAAQGVDAAGRAARRRHRDRLPRPVRRRSRRRSSPASSSASCPHCRRRARISPARSRTAVAPRRRARRQSAARALVVAEVALAVVLLVGAGLFVGSFVRLMRVDPGFDYRNVLTLNVSVRVAGQQFAEAAKRGRAFVAEVLEAVQRIPGVESAAAVMNGGLPLTGSWSRTDVALPGDRSRRRRRLDRARDVTPDYLRCCGFRCSAAALSTADDATAPSRSRSLNDAAARKYFPGEDAIGQRVTIERPGARGRRRRRRHPHQRTGEPAATGVLHAGGAGGHHRRRRWSCERPAIRWRCCRR